MTGGSVSAEPRRLANADDRAGRLLQQAEHAFGAQLSPELAWQRFQSRRQRRRLLGFAIVAAAMGLLVAFTRHRLTVRAIETPTLVAERIPTPLTSAIVPHQAAVLERRISPPPSALPRSRSLATAPSTASSSRRALAPQASEPLTDATCRKWVSQARPELAVDCYQTIGRESGIGAEVALYESEERL